MWVLRVLVIVCFLLPTPILASGLKTHLWIAQRLIEDIQPDCAVTLDNRPYPVPVEMCTSIRTNPGAFLSGTLGPDAYPDLITGQVTTHPGVETDWQTREWLKHIFESAEPGQELAFASGYLVHAASDIFAHTYVNAYSGDIFNLGDERAVERRHFVLEKYIDFHLPAGEPAPDTLQVPADFLARKLILNPDAARVSAKAKYAAHIAAMYGVYTAVDGVTKELDDLEHDVGSALGTITAEFLDLSVRVADGEIGLKLAREALALLEKQLDFQQKLLSGADAALNDAIQAVDRNRELILLSETRARAAREAIKAARNVASEANQAVGSFEREIIGIENRLASIPEKICSKVAGACREKCRIPLVCDLVCGPPEILCSVNKEFANLVHRKNELLSEISRQKQRISQSAVDVAANTAAEGIALQEKIEEEALTAGFKAAQAARQASYDVIKAQYEIQLKATQEARKTCDHLAEELAKLRETLIDKKAIKEAITSLVEQTNLLSGFTRNWRKGMEVASREYINTAHRVSILLVKGESGIFTEYGHWLSCYGGAFTPVPYQVGKWGCDAVSEFEQLQAKIDSFIVRNLPPPFDRLYAEYIDVKARIKGEVMAQVNKAGLELVKLVSPDQTTTDFIALLANPSLATRGKLNEVFAEVADADSKPLLVFSNIADAIDRDAGIVGGNLNPGQFAALQHAITLSKLALLDQIGVKNVIWDQGGNPDVTLQAGTRYSLLFETVRSIDGNHQWQPYGIPYASSNGALRPTKIKERHFGYGPKDTEAHGLPIFIDPVLRRRVFLRLFPRPVSGSLAQRPELAKDVFPFSECASNPFPVTFSANGDAATADWSCRNAPATRMANVGDSLRRNWRRLLRAFGFTPRLTTS